MSKNWSNDTKVGYKAPNNLVELVDSKLDELKNSFERDELKEDYFNFKKSLYLSHILKNK